MTARKHDWIERLQGIEVINESNLRAVVPDDQVSAIEGHGQPRRRRGSAQTGDLLIRAAVEHQNAIRILLDDVEAIAYGIRQNVGYNAGDAKECAALIGVVVVDQ